MRGEVRHQILHSAMDRNCTEVNFLVARKNWWISSLMLHLKGILNSELEDQPGHCGWLNTSIWTASGDFVHRRLWRSHIFLSFESTWASIAVLCWVEIPFIARQRMLWLVNKLLHNLLVVTRDQCPKTSRIFTAHISKQESVIIKLDGGKNTLKVLSDVHQKKAFTCFLRIVTYLRR